MVSRSKATFDIDDPLGKTSLQIQTTIAMALTIAALILIRSRNQSATIPTNKEIWRMIGTIMVTLTSGMRQIKRKAPSPLICLRTIS